MCPSPGPSGWGCPDCWKSLFCLIDSCHGISHSTSPWYRGGRGCTQTCWPFNDRYHDRVSEGVWVNINVWKLSRPWENVLHIMWPQLSGDTQSDWKQKKRGVQHTRRWQILFDYSFRSMFPLSRVFKLLHAQVVVIVSHSKLFLATCLNSVSHRVWEVSTSMQSYRLANSPGGSINGYQLRVLSINYWSEGWHINNYW